MHRDETLVLIFSCFPVIFYSVICSVMALLMNPIICPIFFSHFNVFFSLYDSCAPFKSSFFGWKTKEMERMFLLLIETKLCATWWSKMGKSTKRGLTFPLISLVFRSQYNSQIDKLIKMKFCNLIKNVHNIFLGFSFGVIFFYFHIWAVVFGENWVHKHFCKLHSSFSSPNARNFIRGNILTKYNSSRKYSLMT